MLSTVGSSLAEAALRMELVEHNAQITMFVRQLGKPFVLSAGELESLMAIRRKMIQRTNLFA